MSKVDLSTMSLQVERLSTLHGWGFVSEVGKADYLACAREFGISIPVVRGVIDKLQADAEDLPSIAEFRKLLLAAQPVTPVRNDPDCIRCHGTGWQRFFALHTRTRDRGVVKEWITEEVYERLWRELRDSKSNTQSTHEGVRACPAGCQPRGHFHPENVR